MQFYNTDDLPTDLAEKSFAANMARIFPNGEAPLFAISGLAEKKIAKQIEHGYWQKRMVFGTITLDGAIADGTTTTFNVVDSSKVSPNDVLRVPKAFNADAFVAPEHVRVKSITDATTIEVERGFGGTSGAAAAIADATVIPGIGNAYPEGSPRPMHKAIKSQRKLNNTQIFRNSWSTSKTLAANKLIAGKGAVAENRMDASNFHSRDIELATFFGRKSNGIDPETGEPIHTMDGIEALIEQEASTNIREAGATTTYDQLIDLLDPVFDEKTDMMSGNQRVIYCGKTALKVFHQIGRLSGEYQIVQGQNSFGQKFTEIQIPRGTFRLIEHPIMNTNLEWQKMAVILDLSSFDFAYLEGRDTEITFINENANATDGQDAKGGVLTTELTIELQNPFACGIIYNLRAGAAA